MLAIGAELAVGHIEAGARSFAEFVAAMARDLGSKITDLRPYLRSWYNAARDLMEDLGLDVAGMDSPDAVRTELERLLKEEADLGLQYATMILNHWKKWRPKNFKEMRKAGTLNEFVQGQSKLAAKQVANLMSKGLQQRQAEELVLPDIIWPPENPD